MRSLAFAAATSSAALAAAASAACTRVSALSRACFELAAICASKAPISSAELICASSVSSSRTCHTASENGHFTSGQPKKTSTGSTAQADITPPARRCIALLAIRLKGGKPAYPHKSCGGVFRCHPTKGKSTMGFTALQVGMEQPLAGRCIALLAIQLPRGGRPHIRTRAAGDVFSCYPTKGKSTRWERLPVG